MEWKKVCISGRHEIYGINLIGSNGYQYRFKRQKLIREVPEIQETSFES